MLFFFSGVQVSMQLLRFLFFLLQLADTWSTRDQLFLSSGYRNLGYDIHGSNFWSFMKESPLLPLTDFLRTIPLSLLAVRDFF